MVARTLKLYWKFWKSIQLTGEKDIIIGATSFKQTILSITTFSTMTLSMRGLIVTLNINRVRYNECNIFVMQNVVNFYGYTVWCYAERHCVECYTEWLIIIIGGATRTNESQYRLFPSTFRLIFYLLLEYFY